MTSKSLKLKWNLPWSQWFFLKFSSEKRERARGSDPHPDVCMKVWFEVKVTRGFSLSSPLCGSLSLSRIKISRKTSGTRVSGTMSRKVSPPLTSFPSFLNVSFSLYPHEPASTWCHWKGSAFTTISLTSPHVRESMTVLDSGFHPVDSGFRVLDSGFQLSGFRIPKRAGFQFFSVLMLFFAFRFRVRILLYWKTLFLMHDKFVFFFDL